MFIIFMRNYLKFRLAYNGIFVCFEKGYFQMTPVVQADGFEQSIF